MLISRALQDVRAATAGMSNDHARIRKGSDQDGITTDLPGSGDHFISEGASGHNGELDVRGEGHVKVEGWDSVTDSPEDPNAAAAALGGETGV